MKINLTIKNYRCFVQPVTVEITKGFTSFVGINNAGKSAIMRFLLEFRNLFGDSLLSYSSNIGNLIFSNGMQGNFSPIHVLDPQEIFSNLNDNPIEFWFDFEQGDPSLLFPSKVYFKVLRNLSWKMEVVVNGEQLKPINSGHGAHDNVVIVGGIRKMDCTPIMDLMKILSNTLYIGPFRNAINIGTRTDYIDIQIGQSFITQFKSLKTGNNKKNSLAISELTKEITTIFGFEKLEINPSDDNQTLHININNKPYMQHELGSGLLQFILVLANLLVKKPAYVLIDEPELNLHPKLQIDFLTTLGSYVSQGVWFSTHSIGLARSSSQNLYSVLKIKDGDSIIKPLEGTPRLSEFLGEMSFSSHQELGFEKVLLVEGTTDVPVFQQFLRKLKKDHHVVILPLAGNIHGGMADQLEEVKRITNNISVIIDSEKTSEGETLSKSRNDFIELCKNLSIPYHVLNYRATENYFTDSAIKQVFGDSFRSLSPYELLKDINPNWGKNQNYRLAKEMSIEDLEKIDFWEFLKNI